MSQLGPCLLFVPIYVVWSMEHGYRTFDQPLMASGLARLQDAQFHPDRPALGRPLTTDVLFFFNL